MTATCEVRIKNDVYRLAANCVAGSGDEMRALAAEYEGFSLGMSPEDFVAKATEATPRQLAVAKQVDLAIQYWNSMESIRDAELEADKF